MLRGGRHRHAQDPVVAVAHPAAAVGVARDDPQRAVGGDLVIVCACPALGVPETRTVVPAAVLAGAAERIEVLWAVEPRAAARPPAPPPIHPPAGGWFERVLASADAPASPDEPGPPDEPASPPSPA